MENTSNGGEMNVQAQLAEGMAQQGAAPAQAPNPEGGNTANDFINSIIGGNSNAGSQALPQKCYAGLDMEFGGGIDDATVKNFEAIINDDEDIESGKSVRVAFADVAKTFSDVYNTLSEEDKKKGKVAFAGVSDPYQRMKLMTKLYKKVINSDTRYGNIVRAGGKEEYISQLESKIKALEGAGASVQASMKKIQAAANTPTIRYASASDPDAPMSMSEMKSLSEVFRV